MGSMTQVNGANQLCLEEKNNCKGTTTLSNPGVSKSADLDVDHEVKMRCGRICHQDLDMD